jgi:hypothetical protein
MAITKLNKHDTHEVKIHQTKAESKHYAALRCCDCNTHIQWLSQSETNELKSMGVSTVSAFKGVDVYDLYS